MSVPSNIIISEPDSKNAETRKEEANVYFKSKG